MKSITVVLLAALLPGQMVDGPPADGAAADPVLSTHEQVERDLEALRRDVLDTRQRKTPPSAVPRRRADRPSRGDKSPPVGASGIDESRLGDKARSVANRRLLDGNANNPEIEGLIESAELAYRMQPSVPATLDLSRETQATRQLYGLDDARTSRFATQCVMARRLAERGVRFIQLTSAGWDHHSKMRSAFERSATATDKPIAGLIADLKRRDLLRDTLIMGGGEFGRQPNPDNNGGRGHNNRGTRCGWRAAASKAASGTAAPIRSAGERSPVRWERTTRTPPSCTCSDSITSS